MRPGVGLACFMCKLYGGILAVGHMYREEVGGLFGSYLDKWLF